MMSSSVSFSVLMAVYKNDNPILFELALASVFSNTLVPNEIVLVQDGPVGCDIKGVIDCYMHRKGFKHVELHENKGLACALNFGLQHIENPYVFRADSDDINLPHRFEKQIQFLISGYDLVGGSIMEMDELGNPIAIRKLPESQDEIGKFMPRRNPFNHMTVAFRLSSVVSIGGYPNIFLKEDYALWASMFLNGAKMINLDEVLVHATAGPAMYKRRGGLKYVRSEVDLQLFLIKKELQTVTGAVIYGSLRSLIFILPGFLRGFIYERYLRNRI